MKKEKRDFGSWLVNYDSLVDLIRSTNGVAASLLDHYFCTVFLWSESDEGETYWRVACVESKTNGEISDDVRDKLIAYAKEMFPAVPLTAEDELTNTIEYLNNTIKELEAKLADAQDQIINLNDSLQEMDDK